MVKVIVIITIIIINIIINYAIITITDEELDNFIINYLMKIKVVYMKVEICYLMKIIIRMKFYYMKKVKLAELFMIINNSVVAN